MASPESSKTEYVFKSSFSRVKEPEKRDAKEWMQGIGAAFALCAFSFLFCTVIMMRFP